MSHWTQAILCKMRGHQWENFLTYVPVRAGPLMATICKRCGEHGNFPDNLPAQQIEWTYSAAPPVEGEP